MSYKKARCSAELKKSKASSCSNKQVSKFVYFQAMGPDLSHKERYSVELKQTTCPFVATSKMQICIVRSNDEFI